MSGPLEVWGSSPLAIEQEAQSKNYRIRYQEVRAMFRRTSYMVLRSILAMSSVAGFFDQFVN
jgi:hypothetical protein